MDISIQYLEGGESTNRISPQAARLRLRDALERAPFTKVLLGWDLDAHVVEACAEECVRQRCELYLWQPLLTGHGSFVGDPEWRVVGLDGEPVAGSGGKVEFTFMCPNRRSVNNGVLASLSEAVSSGYYNGVFLDRIRFPSPALNIAGQFACFCDACHEAAHSEGLDLCAVRQGLSRLTETAAGRQALLSQMLSACPAHATQGEVHLLGRMLEFRQQSVGRFVFEVAQAAHSKGLKVGLDCFSPTLTRMVGQDLPTLAKNADWIKVMTYARAFAPASLSYEAVGLVNWLMSSGQQTEQQALDCLAASTGWSLPPSRSAIQSGGLPCSILTCEIERGHSAAASSLLAGIELVEMQGISHLTTAQIQEDAVAVRAGQPDGVVLCWDLWQMPLERVEQAASLYASA